VGIFAACVKPEVVVSRPEVDLREWKWLPRPSYFDSDHAVCEGVFCFDSVSITFVEIADAHANGDQPFWATITSNSSPYAAGPLSCLPCLSVCNIGVLWRNGWMVQGAT